VTSTTRNEALRRFIQAYLASVASVDQQIGRILDVVDNSALRENTIIILTSDHGWGNDREIQRWDFKDSADRRNGNAASRPQTKKQEDDVR
jgi:arylsulfatase A-like enzyme